jgi:hypothetical protein
MANKSLDKEKTGLVETPEDTNPQEKVRQWRKVINRTLEWRKQIEQKARWPFFIKEFEGDWTHVQADLDIDLIPINLVFAYVKTEIARLYFRDPFISVNAKRMEDLGKAQIAEQLINYIWGDLNLKSEVKKALLDTLLVGHGWVKVGYSMETGISESKSKDSKEKPVSSSEFIKSEEVFAYHVPWQDVLFAPDSLNPPYDSRWMAFRIVKPLSAIKKSKIYKNTEDLKPQQEQLEDKSLDVMRDVQNATLWEIWDKDHDEVITIAHGADDPLREIDWPYEIEGMPGVMFKFNIVPGKPYPLSDVAPWEGQIIEAMKLIAIMINHLKRWNRLMVIQEGTLTPIEENKFKQGVDGAIIRAQNLAGAGKPLAENFFIPPYAPVQQDIYGVWNLVMDLWRNVSGQSDVDRGSHAKTQTRTLGELRMTMQGGRARADEKVDQLEDSISEVARKLLGIMKQKMQLPMIIKVVGEQAMQKAMEKSPPEFKSLIPNTDLPEEMDVDTVAGSTVPLNKENKLTLAAEFLKMLPAVGIAPNSQASREVGRFILREFDVKEMERIMDIADQEAKQAAQMQQMQMQMMMKEHQAKAQEQQSDQVQGQLKLAATQAQTKATMAQAQANTIQAQIKLKETILKSILAGQVGGQNGSPM